MYAFIIFVFFLLCINHYLPAETCSTVSLFVKPGYGVCPDENISHINTPKLQTSLKYVYFPKNQKIIIIFVLYISEIYFLKWCL